VKNEQATYLSWSVQCCPNNSFGKWQIQLSLPTSTRHGRQANSSMKVQYSERKTAKANKQPNNNIWKMASPALLPNITLPFILPPVNLSTIYQDYFEPLNLSLPLNISALNPVLENLPLNPWKTPSRDPTDWLTDGATLGLVAALIQMIAGAGFDSLQSPPTDGGLPTNRRVDGDVDGGLSFEKKVEEYLKMKNARKRGEFNDEVDLDEALYQDYYQDFDVEGDVDDNDNFYDYYDFIANTDPGKLEGDTSTGSTGGGTEDAMRFKQEQESQRRRMISRQLLKEQLLMAKKRQRQFLIAKKQQQILAANRQLQQQQQLQKQKQVRVALARRFLALSQKAMLAKSRF